MEHTYWVIDGLLAGRPGPTCAPWNPAALHEGGIRAVVSLAKEVPVEDLSPFGITHYRGEFPPMVLFSEGMRKAFIYTALPVWRFIDEQITVGKTTLVHCFAGQDRTGAILSGYLVTYHGMEAEKAVAVVRNSNPFAMRETTYEETVHLLHPYQLPHPDSLL
jgi:hypothetical protein